MPLFGKGLTRFSPFSRQADRSIGLRFLAVAGHTCVIELQQDSAEETWQAWEQIDSDNVNRVVQRIDPNDDPQPARYYRLRPSAPPHSPGRRAVKVRRWAQSRPVSA